MEQKISDIEALIIAAADPDASDQKTITLPPIHLRDLRDNPHSMDFFLTFIRTIKHLDGKNLKRVEWINEIDRETNPDKTIGHIRIHYSDRRQ